MTTKIAKITTKGQVTLPKKWRKKFATDNFLLEMRSNSLLIKPVNLDDLNEEVIFDSGQDNNGQGVPVKDVISHLEKLLDE